MWTSLERDRWPNMIIRSLLKSATNATFLLHAAGTSSFIMANTASHVLVNHLQSTDPFLSVSSVSHPTTQRLSRFIMDSSATFSAAKTKCHVQILMLSGTRNTQHHNKWRLSQDDLNSFKMSKEMMKSQHSPPSEIYKSANYCCDKLAVCKGVYQKMNK